jgi:hypothetical protein
MKTILAAWSLVAVFAGVAQAAGCSRLSWGTCDPWVENTSFTGPATYVLVWSIAGTGDSTTGTDGVIHIGNFGLAPVPDAWRFDDGGCQTFSRIGLSTAGFSKSCAAFQGGNSLPIASCVLDQYGQPDLYLADSFDLFTPNAANRYTAWVVNFDHSFSSVGPTPPFDSTCGGAERCVNLVLTYAHYVTADNQTVLMPSCDSDPSFPAPYWSAVRPGSTSSNSGFALWNGGCLVFDATRPSTWGRLKGLYR